MKNRAFIILHLAFGLGLFLSVSVTAQQHRATRLGHPATRFAPPLEKPEDLRARFRDEKLKPDIASILNQWGWKGNLSDLHHAALNAEITEVKIPVGARMPFMSSREKGKPICLRDVLWAGQEPISAYAFHFTSNGRRYRCVTPRPCSNFFLEDEGADLPRLQLTKTAPAEANLCAPFEVKLAVRNTGSIAATQIQVIDTLPVGLKTTQNQSALTFDIASLSPGEGREFGFQIQASAIGSYVNTARLTSAGGGRAEASATTVVLAPVLALECSAPAETLAGRPVSVCLTAKSIGNVPEAKAILTLPIPQGARVVSATEGGISAEGRVTWEIPNFAPGASQKVCAILTMRQPGELSFNPSIRGECAPLIQAACTTKAVGIPAILLEVVDLEDPIEVGQEVTYVIKVLNQGTAAGTNIRLACAMEETQEFISGTGATPVRALERMITTEPLPVLAPKAEVTWRVAVKAAKAGDARFKVELRSDQFEQPIPEVESTQQY